MEVAEYIKTQVEALPHKPGVYIMRNSGGEVIYVGKAVDLRSRVRSYLHPSAWVNPKVRALVAELAGLQFIVADSELEALILEANLIKEHRPRYNVRLKDDKWYPYIKITLGEPFPRVLITRRMEQDGSRYFGPYTSSASVRQTLELLRKSFPYLSCGREITGRDVRPCLYYEIKLCLGPCIGAVTQEEYRTMIKGLVRFLEGHSNEVIADLEARMREAAERLEFERAASLRDQLLAVQHVVSQQKIISPSGGDQDVIAFARDDGDACVQVFFIRGGKLLGQEYFVLEGAQDEDEQEVMAAFLKQFYEEAACVPGEILLPEQIEESLIIEQWLRSKRGAKVTIHVPRRGQKRELVKMAAENAAETLAALRAQWRADAHKHEKALAELKEALELPDHPVRIECYDISTTQGVETVGSMVVFVHAVPRKSEYRRFVIRDLEGQDDYAAMRQVLQRRFHRWQLATSEEVLGARDVKGWARLPDLLVVDGGPGQVGVATEVLRQFALEGRIPVIGLAKQREEVFLPGRSAPLVLPRGSEALLLLQYVRDEAHRFAITHHRTRRHRAGVASQLDSIPGVGPARRAALLRAFGSIDAIRAASVEQLAAVPGIPLSVAQAIKENL
jgi:excinuclease ABC subunit C